MNSAFIAIKLLPGSDSGDIQPLRMTLSGDIPTIPIIPTSVAAEPDMGILVHLLGESRAVPINYRHVQINEAAIDWIFENNYMDVVSQAIDEAGGQAFATDYAGPVKETAPLYIATDEDFDDFLSWETGRQYWRSQMADRVASDQDYQRIFRRHVTLPDEINFEQFFGRFNTVPRLIDTGDIVIDRDGIIAGIRDELNPMREEINEHFSRQPYLTRMYSTLSPEEMTIDPEFGFNADLEDVDNIRTAVQYMRCNSGVSTRTEYPSGIALAGGYPVIRRQAGETVRGMDVPGARIIEQHMPAGQPMLIADQTAEIYAAVDQAIPEEMGGGGETGAAGTPGANGTFVMPDANGGATAEGSEDTMIMATSDDAGCDCSVQSGQSMPHPWTLVMLTLLVVTRRRLNRQRSYPRASEHSRS